MKCSACKRDLRIGKGETVRRDGKDIRVLTLVCVNRECAMKGQAQETIEKEVNHD